MGSMLFYCGGKPEYPKKIQRGSGNKIKVLKGRPEPGGDCAHLCTTPAARQSSIHQHTLNLQVQLANLAGIENTFTLCGEIKMHLKGSCTGFYHRSLFHRSLFQKTFFCVCLRLTTSFAKNRQSLVADQSVESSPF